MIVMIILTTVTELDTGSQMRNILETVFQTEIWLQKTTTHKL